MTLLQQFLYWLTYASHYQWDALYVSGGTFHIAYGGNVIDAISVASSIPGGWVGQVIP